MSDEIEHHESHGHSTAAWTGVGVILAGFTVGCIGMVIPSATVVILGFVIMAVGLAAGVALAKMGYGAAAHHAQAGPLADAPDETGAETVGKS